MDADSAEALVQCVHSTTGDEPTLFFLPWAANGNAYEDEAVYRGAVADLLEVQRGVWQLTPEYAWPDSHVWCISTDRDSHYSLVGGSADLIRGILDHPNLESTSVDPSTRLDGAPDT